MRMRLILVATVVVAMVTGCAGKAPAAGRDDDVREAIYRYQFLHNHSGLQQRAKIFCLSVGDRETDPSDAFLLRFQENTPPIRKVSDCSASPQDGVNEKATGAPGLIFRVGTIKWRNQFEAEAEGGYYEAGLSAAGTRYRVQRKGADWIVTVDQDLWIS